MQTTLNPPIKHDLLNGGVLFLIWSAVILILSTAQRNDSYFIQACFIFATAILQLHLDALQHEACHRMLFRNRMLNDSLGQLLCYLPLFSEIKSYRSFHFEHHRYLGDLEKDPEVPYYRSQGYDYQPMSGARLLKLCVLDFSGYHFAQYFISSLVDECRSRFRTAIIELLKIGAAQLTIISIFGLQTYLLFWLLPLVTIRFALLKWQAYSEHIIYTDIHNDKFHTIKTNILTRLLVFPLGAQFHMVHHVRPNVVWYQLAKALPTIKLRQLSGVAFGRSSVLNLMLAQKNPNSVTLNS
jgi:fatty acid desaturase